MEIISKEEFENKIKSDEYYSLAIGEIKPILNKYFFFSEKDVKETIEKIVANGDSNFALKMADIIKKFADNAGEGVQGREIRKSLAKSAITNAIRLYNNHSQEVKEEFFEILKRAKQFKIDPLNLANMTNFRYASVKNWEYVLTCLLDDEYAHLSDQAKEFLAEDASDFSREERLDFLYKNLNEMYGSTSSTLFDKEDVEKLIKDCSSCIFDINKQNIQQVMLVLESFFYIPEKNEYVLSAKDAFKSAFTLLIAKPKNLKNTINFLEKHFVNKNFSREDLARRVAQSPSMLGCNPENIDMLFENMQTAIYKILSDKNSTIKCLNKTEESLKIAEEFCFDLDRFSVLSNLKEENIKALPKLAETLIRHFGADNAMWAIRDVNFIKIKPAIIDSLLCKLGLDEKKCGKPLRTFCLLHSAKALGVLKSGENLSDAIANSSKEKTRKIKSKIKKSDLKKLENNITQEDFEKSFDRLSAEDKKTVLNLADHVKKNLEKAEKDPEFIGQLLEEEFSSITTDDPYKRTLEKMAIALDVVQDKKHNNLRQGLMHLSDIYDNFCKLTKRFGSYESEIRAFDKTLDSEKLVQISSKINKFDAQTSEIFAKLGKFYNLIDNSSLTSGGRLFENPFEAMIYFLFAYQNDFKKIFPKNIDCIFSEEDKQNIIDSQLKNFKIQIQAELATNLINYGYAYGELNILAEYLPAKFSTIEEFYKQIENRERLSKMSSEDIKKEVSSFNLNQTNIIGTSLNPLFVMKNKLDNEYEKTIAVYFNDQKSNVSEYKKEIELGKFPSFRIDDKNIYIFDFREQESESENFVSLTMGSKDVLVLPKDKCGFNFDGLDIKPFEGVEHYSGFTFSNLGEIGFYEQDDKTKNSSTNKEKE